MGSAPDPAWLELRERVIRRDRDCLLAFRRGCHRQLDPHHLILKGQGGPDADWNLATLCRIHHAWVHAHPLLAQSMGLLVPSWVGHDGCVLSRPLLARVRDGHPSFAPWLNAVDVQETIAQDRRWEDAILFTAWTP